MGVSLIDRSLREAMKLLGELLETESLGTVCFLSNELLIKAKDDTDLRDAIQGMDLPVAASVEILEAGGIKSVSRLREVEGNYFIKEMLKKLAREKKKIFLIGNSQDELVTLRETLLSVAGKLTFFGSFAYDGPETSQDAVINAINTIIPDVIISAASSPEQEHLMHNSRNMVNSRVWISLQPEVLKKLGDRKRGGFLSDIIDRLIFKRTLRNFDDKG